MSTNGGKRKSGAAKRKVPTGRHVRFPTDLIDWLETYAKEQGFNSDADAIRQIVREKRQQVEQARAATA